MKTARLAVAMGALALLGCDEKPTPAAAPSASTPEVAVTSKPIPSSVWSGSPPASATPFASAGASLVTGDGKDVVLTVKDPAKEAETTVKAQAGGSVTLFLPDFPGTVWSVETSDRALGKAQEEVIPGFAPGTNGHQFKWATTGPLIKAGGKHKATLGNRKTANKAGKADSQYTLTIEIN